MNGRTHEAVGIATALIVMHGAGTRESVIGCIMASFGAVVPDVDLIDNRKGKGLQMAVEAVRQSMIPIGFAMYYGASACFIAAWIAVIVFLVVQPHRGFSHSIWCLTGTAALLGYMTDYMIVRWYIAAYMSHIILDVMNTKKVSIFYPGGFCVGLFKSGGTADWIIGFVASAIIFAIAVSKVLGVDVVDIVIKEVIR